MFKLYYIELDARDFLKFQNEIILKDLLIKDEKYCFYADRKSFLYLMNNEVKFTIIKDYPQIFWQTILLKKGLIAGLVVFFLSFFIGLFYVNGIIYNGDFLINGDIAAELRENYNRVLGFDFIGEKKLKAINKEIRKKYTQYEWISLEKKGFKIYVSVNKDELDRNKDINLETEGDIIAKRISSIYYIEVFSGIPLVKYGDTVKEGDILVSGVLGNAGKEEYVMAKGLILARTVDYIDIRVKREVVLNEATGKASFYSSFNFFGLKFDYKNKADYQEFETKEKTVFNIFDIFSWKKVEKYEKSDIIFSYTPEDAYLYAISQIEADFDSKKIHKDEKIVEILKLLESEDTSYRYYRFLVKKIESIGLFKGRE